MLARPRLLALVAALMFATTPSAAKLAKCTPWGQGRCSACKNCKYCGHCAKGGGHLLSLPGPLETPFLDFVKIAARPPGRKIMNQAYRARFTIRLTLGLCGALLACVPIREEHSSPAP